MSVYREPGDVRMSISRSLVEQLLECISHVGAMSAIKSDRGISWWDELRAAESALKLELEQLDGQVNGWAEWPEDVPKRYNACTDPCDMWTGPCACGAFHRDGK